jgi:hypothetical protein
MQAGKPGHAHRERNAGKNADPVFGIIDLESILKKVT